MPEIHLAIEASPEEALVLFEAGQIYYLRHQYPKAETVLRGALVLNPGNGDILAALGATLHVQQKYDEALECYEQALTACPSEDCARTNKGELLLLNGKKEEAIAELKQAIENVGEDSELSERARALLQIAESSE